MKATERYAIFEEAAKVTIKGGQPGSQNQLKALEVQDTDGNASLQVFNDGKVVVGSGHFNQTDDRASIYLGNDESFIRSTFNHGMSFSVGNIPWMTIREETGRVGIGTTGPAVNLHVMGIQAKFRVGQVHDYITMGYDGVHSIIDSHNSSLLVNYYSGEDVAFGAPSDGNGGGNVSVKIFGDLEICDKLNVLTTDFCDYVFSPEYERPSLEEKEKYYMENRHLHGMPPESEIIEKGMDIAKIIKGLTLNVEEMSLYQIDLYKMILELKEENQRLRELIQNTER